MTLWVIHSREIDCSMAKCYGSDWDSNPCPQGHLPCDLSNWAISPPPCYECAVTSQYPPSYDLRCCYDVKTTQEKDSNKTFPHINNLICHHEFWPYADSSYTPYLCRSNSSSIMVSLLVPPDGCTRLGFICCCCCCCCCFCPSNIYVHIRMGIHL